METYKIIMDDSLEHHGIMGQKWGKKNGPPYPLEEKEHSESEKKAGWKKSLAKTASSTIKTAGKVTSTTIKSTVPEDASKDKKKEAASKAAAIEEGTNKASSKIGELGKKEIDLSGMTDDDLRKIVNRLNMEQQYRNLTNSTDVKSGRDYTKAILSAAADIIIPIGTVVLAEMIKKKIK